MKHILGTSRETGYQTTCSIIKVCCKTAETEEVENPIKKFAFLFATQLSIGLADNWSQVSRLDNFHHSFNIWFITFCFPNYRLEWQRWVSVSKLIFFISFKNYFSPLFRISRLQLLDNFLFAWKDQIKTVKSTLFYCQGFAWIDTISLKALEYTHKM